MTVARRSIVAFAVASTGLVAMFGCSAGRSELDQDAETALQRLYASDPDARELDERAKAILVFPRIVKAGLLVGGQSGNGVLFVNRKPTGYYNISAASWGLQAGGQQFSYALFFMKDSALDYLKRSHGWAVGTGPSIAVIDKGAAKSFTSTTLTQDVYAFPYGQSGLMAGIGIEGSKITEFTPS